MKSEKSGKFGMLPNFLTKIGKIYKTAEIFRLFFALYGYVKGRGTRKTDSPGELSDEKNEKSILYSAVSFCRHGIERQW